jgi:hypothetical protein
MISQPFALGFRVKSGYAITVALAGPAASPAPLARIVVALSDPKIAKTKQPFHHGFGAAQADQTEIARLVTIIERCARGSIDALLADSRFGVRVCRGAGLVVGSVIDPAAVGNLHIRAHASEGRLFRTVIADALAARKIDCAVHVEKQLGGESSKALKRTSGEIARTVSEFGRTLGPPWRAEEKAAATAAWLALSRFTA